MTPKAYILLSLILGAVIGLLRPIEAARSPTPTAASTWTARTRRRRTASTTSARASRDTINAQHIKLAEEQQDEIDAMKKTLQNRR